MKQSCRKSCYADTDFSRKDKGIMKYQKIKEALQALQEGKLVLVMDDKERENEGDLICSAHRFRYQMKHYLRQHNIQQ